MIPGLCSDIYLSYLSYLCVCSQHSRAVQQHVICYYTMNYGSYVLPHHVHMPPPAPPAPLDAHTHVRHEEFPRLLCHAAFIRAALRNPHVSHIPHSFHKSSHEGIPTFSHTTQLPHWHSRNSHIPRSFHKGSAKPAPFKPTKLQDVDGGTWAGPFVMEGVNARIVQYSNALVKDAYGSDFKCARPSACVSLMLTCALIHGSCLRVCLLSLTFTQAIMACVCVLLCMPMYGHVHVCLYLCVSMCARVCVSNWMDVHPVSNCGWSLRLAAAGLVLERCNQSVAMGLCVCPCMCAHGWSSA